MTLRFHHQLSLLWLALILAMNVQRGLSASLRHRSPQESADSHPTTSDNQEQVTSENGEDDKYIKIEDMMLLRKRIKLLHEERERRHAVADQDLLWPNGVVPYVITSVFNDLDKIVIRQAMDHWEDTTCIRFRERTTEAAHVRFISADGCYSYVGRQGGSQVISLGPGCVHFEVVVHELGHALGFYHEHTRPDRDNYIDVIYENIYDYFESQFNKIPIGESDTLGLGYDIQSIMHYDSNFFSLDGSRTIVALDSSQTVGMATELSPLDIQKANTLYNCEATCSRNFTSTNGGTIQSQNWPQTYPNNTDCEWFIDLPDPNARVVITCNKDNFEVAGTYPDCDEDYLIIYDGHSENDTTYGPFCGSHEPGNIKMSSSKARLAFHSGPNHSASHAGFKCTFKSVPRSPCDDEGLTLNTAQGLIKTPNWPDAYPTNIDCHWRIELPDDTAQVQIDCLEYYPFIIRKTPGCTKHYMKIYDGLSVHNDSYGPYCGYAPPNITMSSNKALVAFRAGPKPIATQGGFKCVFQSIKNGSVLQPPTPPPTTAPPPSTLCNLNLTQSTGTLETPYWPQSYPSDIDCEWNIVLPKASERLELIFENLFGIAGSMPNCESDYVKIYDSDTGSEYGPYCGSTAPSSLVMSSNKAKVVFHANSRDNSSLTGFQASYRSLCGPLKIMPSDLQGIYQCNTFVLPGETFGSPNFPSFVSSPRDCSWTLVGSANKKYQVRITHFDIPDSQACYYDNLQIHDGISSASPKIHKICGDDYCNEAVVSLQIDLSGRFGYVRQHFTSTGNFRGFRATFEEV